VAILAVFVTSGADIEIIAAIWSVTYLLGASVAVLITARGVPRGESSEAPSRGAMLRFGSKSVLGWASPVENFRLDQLVVGLFLSPVALGLYVAGLALTNLPRFIAQSVGIVAYPAVAAKATPIEARRTVWTFFWGTVAVSAVIVAAIWVLADWLVPLLFGAAFADAVGLTRILLISALLLSARRALTDGTRGAGYAGLGTIAELVSWVTLIPAVALLAASSGAEGVALALGLASAVSLATLAGGFLIGSRRDVATALRAESMVSSPALPQPTSPPT
jgi:O-antigen/teichoic acid export membrane protein